MDDKKLEAHLFICTNRREGGKACCADRGASELRDQVKAIAKPRWRKRLRVNAAGCLGHCEEGITAVLYPQGRWLTGLTRESAPELIRLLEEALGPGQDPPPGGSAS